jgi:hypothetical protein
MSSCSFKLICLNDLCEKGSESSPNALIFAGTSAPDITREDINWQYHSLRGGYKLRWTVAEAGLFPLHPPVSSSISSKAFQTRQLTQFDVKMFKKALGDRGSFPLRKNCDGHNSYPASLRNDNTRASTFPNAGPSTQQYNTYYREGMDVRYLPYAWRTFHDLVQITAPRTRMMYKHLFCTDELPKSPHHWVCKTGIFTVNFCNEMHTDRNDHRPRAKSSILQELQSVFECDSLAKSAISEQARAMYDLVNEFDAPQPTTCCYQFVPTTATVEDHKYIQVHCYFPMPTLGVAHRMFDHWTNIFLGGVLLHGTSVPVFYEMCEHGEEVFVGEHPRLNIVAWGEG